MSSKRHFIRQLSAIALASATWASLASTGWAQNAPVLAVDLDPAQADRVRVDKAPSAIELIPQNYPFVTPGKLTVASIPNRLPYAVYALDAKTPIGAEPDVAQLVADSLGLELVLLTTAWADWPLGLSSGKYDAVIHNITITEERKDKFDFSSYRNDLLGFFVPLASTIESIRQPEDIAGLKVIVYSGTNQEKVLLNWIEQNKAKGLASTELQYHDDDAIRDLTLQSGRADVYFGPNATSAFQAARERKTRQVGSFSGGWPEHAEIGVATRKGAGLAPAVTEALNTQINNGNYAKVLSHWGLTAEAINESRTNPPGLPKK